MTFRESEEFDDARKAELVRAILEAPCEQPHVAVGDQLGVNRETVRRVRFGFLWKKVLPELERLEVGDGLQGRNHTCEQCTHWKPGRFAYYERGVRTRGIGQCTLGIPESVNLKFARGCGAFTQRQP